MQLHPYRAPTPRTPPTFGLHSYLSIPVEAHAMDEFRKGECIAAPSTIGHSFGYRVYPIPHRTFTAASCLQHEGQGSPAEVLHLPSDSCRAQGACKAATDAQTLGTGHDLQDIGCRCEGQNFEVRTHYATIP